MKILVNEEDLKYIEESIMNGLIIKEDLRRWFKEKWVDVSKKVDGKHPPCGRKEAKDKGYPKCRAVGVAGKMTDSQKRSACQQKRKAEKTHSKTGTGNKPKMVSYKPKNESLRDIIKSVLNEEFNSKSL